MRGDHDMSGVSAAPEKTIMIGTRTISRQALLDQGRAATARDLLDVAEGDAIALLIRNHPCYFEVRQAAAHLSSSSLEAAARRKFKLQFDRWNAWMVYPTDHGENTAVTKNLSGEIAMQQSKFILQEISYRRGGK
jgi:hypothetical protein